MRSATRQVTPGAVRLVGKQIYRASSDVNPAGSSIALRASGVIGSKRLPVKMLSRLSMPFDPA